MAEKVKGVRYFLGKEALVRQQTIEKIKESFSLFGFAPVETPSLEYLSLFTGKSGPEIESQLYAFEDKKGEKLALRPEHTISKLNVVVSNKSLTKPFKAYSIGNVWRYEDTARGRYREFMQADVDIYGSTDIAYDAEIVACLDFTLKRLGISHYIIHINNRKRLQALMDDLKVPLETGLQVMRDMDKLDKVGIDKVKERILTLVGDEKTNKIAEFMLGKYNLKGDGEKEVSELVRYLKHYSIDNVKIDNSLVRGLSYYDGNVFEFIFDEKGNKVTIGGGGRYDRLSSNFNVEMSIVGAAIGFDRVIDLLMSMPEKTGFIDSYCVLSVDDNEKAIEIAQGLRAKDAKCDLLFTGGKLSKGLDYCNSNGIRYAVIVGKKDLKEGVVTIRDLTEKSDRKVKLDNL